MSKVSNAINMLLLLSSGRKYTIKELSEILEVTPRMIRSYKDDLDKSGIYIDTIMGPYGGYVLNKTVRLPAQRFKKEDYELLDNYVKCEKDPNKKERLIYLQDKIRGIYIGSKKEKIELEMDSEYSKKYNLLTRAIKERRKVKILYYSYNKGNNERVICPAEMFLYDSGWYCAAFCLLKNDIRHFELKRIINYELLEEKF